MGQKVIRKTACITMLGAGEDKEFTALASKEEVTITGVRDALTREGTPIRVVDYVERSGQAVYKPPIC